MSRSPFIPSLSGKRTIPSRPSQLRLSNARSLLHLLQEHSPCSKADLVRCSGLSAPTVSSGIAHLQGLGLVEHLGDGASSGGRPPGLLRFKASRGYVAAVDIGGTRLRMMLADLSGNMVNEFSLVLPAGQKTPEAVCAQIVDGIHRMCRESGTSYSKILHVTAGAPGITNAATGVVLSAPNLDRWKNVPLRGLLEDAAGLQCAVENDTNLAAQGEFWRGAARHVDSFIFIAMGTGVGAGIFLNGQLHRGAQWSAGEIGYFGVAGKMRQPLQMSKVGQLEAVIGGLGIETEWRCRLQRAGRIAEPGLARLRASQVLDRALGQDPIAAETLRWTAAILADAISDMVLLLNPEVVVLGGGIGSHPELCRVAEELLTEHDFARPMLRSSTLGTQAQLQGAVSVSLAAIESTILN